MSVAWTYEHLCFNPMLANGTQRASSAPGCNSSAAPLSPSRFFESLAEGLKVKFASHINDILETGLSIESRDAKVLELSTAPQLKNSTIKQLILTTSLKLREIGLRLETKYLDKISKAAEDNSRFAVEADMNDTDSRANGVAQQVNTLIFSSTDDIEHSLSIINAQADLVLNNKPSPASSEKLRVNVTLPSSGGAASGALPKPIAQFLTSAAKKLAGTVKDTMWADTLKTASGIAMTATWLAGLGMSVSALLPTSIISIALGISSAGTGLIGIAIIAILAPIVTHFNNELWEALKFSPPPKDTLTIDIDGRQVGAAKA